ncbi:MAG: TonB-dependent receptor [Gemmatimonadaceae bacterium]|nr:TonB-dependent receptor [Gemmatimonadaceae bacterium]
MYSAQRPARRARFVRHVAVYPLAVVAFACGVVAAPRRAAAQGSAQSAALSVVGTVQDSAGRAVASASISVTDPNGRTLRGQSEANGQFRIAVPGSGRYVVQVRALGFASRSVAINAGASGESTVIRLTPSRILSTVQVIGAGTTTTRLHPGADALAGSVSVLSGEQIARENVAFSQELLRKAPGVYRAEFNQGIVAGDIGIRGFNTESEIASAKLLIDGIPSNLNSGVSEMNAIFPLEIERMELVRGTNDPRYGLFNLAGNVAVETQQGGNFLTSRLQGGSFGTTEAQVLAGFARGGFSQTLFGGARQSDGYRQNAGSDKWTGSGKWFYNSPSNRVRVGVIGRVHRLDADAPGYLSLADSRANRQSSPAYSATDGGTVESDHGSLHVDVKQTATLNWSLKAYSQRFDRVRYVRFSAAGAQQERIEDERQTGGIATVTWRPAASAAFGLTVSGGVDLQSQDNVQQRFRTVDRVRQATLRDYDFTLDNRGGFINATASPTSWLQLAAGLRADNFDGAFLNKATSVTLPILDYGWVTQPKLSATVRVNDRLSSYANYGRGFQIGAGVASYGRTPLAASKNDGLEIGIVSSPTASWSLRAGVWQQSASDEVRLKFDNSGDSENIGKTRRRGLDLETTWHLPSNVNVWATGTSQRAILVEPGRANAAIAGNLLNHVPQWTAKYGADWSPSRGLMLSFWSYAQGDYELTPQNDRGRWGDMHTVNADLSWRWRAAALGVGVTNLFDRQMEYVWWDGTQTLHSPAAARGMFLTLTIDR